MNAKKIVLFCVFFITLSANAALSAKGHNFMLVSSQDYATKVGREILKNGGNAIDAAVAIGYALAVVYPCCGNLGGGGFMLIRFANGQTTFFNFREKAPAKASPQAFMNTNGAVLWENLSTGYHAGALKKPYRAVGVPGTVMGLNLALKKYGTLPLASVIQPAILLAEKGFTLLPADIKTLKTATEDFKRQANVAAIFLKDGHSYQPGDLLVQKDLANSLKIIGKEGTKGFYEGEITREIVKASKKNGGMLTLADFKQYSVEETKPITCTYHGYQIITTPPPGSGMTLCETLKILEHYPLKKLGFHSPKGIHYIVEALRFAYRDRSLHLGDPQFVTIPINELLSVHHINTIIKQIKPNRATPSDQLLQHQEGSNTTSYVIVDKTGNAVSVTYTLNDFFGAKVIPGNSGFFLNNEMADFTIQPEKTNNYGAYQGLPNLVAPSKRPLSAMAPTILLKNKKLFMVIGTPGGSTIPSQLVNVILNVVDYGLPIQAAEDAPRFHMQWLPDKIFFEPFALSPFTLRILKKMGYDFKLGSPFGTKQWGAVTGILIDPKTKRMTGAMDYRRPGSAIGE